MAALFALSTSVIAGPSLAAEDGGTRSVFAVGAGNRALALGGAYAAVADDASAPVWNPGGLGFLVRSELQASGAALYGLDISEQFVSLAVPSWRWGTGALSVRHLGVGGIELRDERNLLVDGGISDGETEIMLAYGRSVAEAWSVGGAVKFQRQSVAGLSGSGIGVDFGILGRPAALAGRAPPWLGRVTWGLAVRNLVEPSLRLDRDSISDPSGVRTGIAYRHPLTGHRSILTSLDIEKTKGSEAEIHLGVEAQVHPILALRGGWNAGNLVTGAGVEWRQLSVDFVLDDNDIDTIYRFGVGFRFGATVEESRQAALRAEEEKLQERLAIRFREAEEARVNELLEEANVLLGQERFDRALEALTAVIALEPENARARELEASCLRAKAMRLEAAGEFAEAAILYLRILAVTPDPLASAGLARCRDESDRRAERTARIQTLFASALDAFAAGDPVAARADLQKILEVDPEDAEARAMLARTERAVRSRARDLLEQAERLIDRSQLAEARTLLGEARSLDPAAEGLADLESRVRKAERELAARVQSAPAGAPAASAGDVQAASHGGEAGPRSAGAEGPAASRKRQKEVADLYMRGMTAMEEGRSDEALNYWELVWVADPGYQNVADYLKREYLLRGLSSFSRGDLDDAVRLWERALDFDPSDKRAIGYLARAREQQTRTREILGD